MKCRVLFNSYHTPSLEW